MTYFFPAPAYIVRGYLDNKARGDEPFTDFEAAYDLALADLRGDRKPERYYVGRWKWSQPTINRKKREILRKFIDEMRAADCYTLNQAESGLNQNSAFLGEKMGIVNQNESDLNQYSNSSYNRISSTSVLNKSTKSINKPKKVRKLKTFDPASLPYQYSRRHTELLKLYGKPPKTAFDDEEKFIQAGADIFDKLNRIDGHSWEEVGRIMKWLFEADPWGWVRRGAYCSHSKLRTIHEKSERTHFEFFQMKSSTDNAENPRKSASYDPTRASERIANLAGKITGALASNNERARMAFTG